MEVDFEVGKKCVGYQMSKKREGDVPKRDLGAGNKETLKSLTGMRVLLQVTVKVDLLAWTNYGMALFTAISYESNKKVFLRHPTMWLLSITGSDLSQSGGTLQHSLSHYGGSLDPKRLSRGCHHQCDYKRSPNCWLQWDGLNVYQPSCIWFFLSLLFNYGKILALWLRLFWEPRVTSAKDQEWYVPLGSSSWVQLFSETVFPTRQKKPAATLRGTDAKRGKREMGSSDSKLRFWNLRFA